MEILPFVCVCVYEQLVLSNPGRVVVDKLHASDLVNQIGEDKIFLTVSDAVLTCCSKSPKSPEDVV